MVVGEDQTLRYAITNLNAEPEGPAPATADERQQRWLRDLRRWADAGIDFVQFREKALPASEQYTLLTAAVAYLRSLAQATRPRLLVNGRPDLALAAGADGVHLTARVGELRPGQVRQLFAAAGQTGCCVSVSCHTLEEVAAARAAAADLLLFGPVFGKRLSADNTLPGTGLQVLERAAEIAAPVPLLALGGVQPADLAACQAAGAAGVAGIRLFAPAETRPGRTFEAAHPREKMEE